MQRSQVDELIRELYQKRSWFWFGKGSQKRKLQVLKSLAVLGTPFKIPFIFQFLFSLNTKISHETAQTVHELMSKVKPEEWTELYPSFQNIQVMNVQLDFLRSFPDELAVDLLGVASLNGDGYVRQAAIRQLQTIDSPKKIVFIMLRLADWVSQVRETAKLAIMECLTKEYTQRFLSYTCVLDWMNRVTRVNLSPIRNQIINYLTSSPSRQHVESALDDPDKRVRRFCYRILMQTPPIKSEIVDKGAKDSDPEIQWIMFQNIRNLSEDCLVQYLPYFLGNPSSKVCSSAMMTIPKEHWEKFKDVVFENLFSTSSSVRNTARFVLKEYGFTAFADEYRKRIATGLLTPGVLSGLGETGNSDDFAILEAHVSNARASIRSAGIAGLHGLHVDQSVSYLIEALNDPSSKVRRVSRVLLCKDCGYDREAVRRILKNGTSSSKVSALKVLCHSFSWKALEDILVTLPDRDEMVRKTAWSTYVRWYRHRTLRNWAGPSQSVLASVEEELMKLASRTLEVPDFATGSWQDLPSLIESGKRIWRL
jgi:hypothetical protein